MSTLGLAISIAAQAHSTQTDKGGNAYILHPIRLMMRLRTDDQELMQIAIMHDVIEDSTLTLAGLKEFGFSKRVLDALALLTHDKKDSYQEYIKKIATNVDAIRVKLEDLKDNSDLSRLKGVSQKDFDRVIKYQKSYTYLKGVQKLSENL